MLSTFRTAAFVCAAAVIPSFVYAQISYRPGREYRSLNTELYEVAIQKNGRLDVALSSGEMVFENVFPMAWLEGEDEPRTLTVDGRFSGRFSVQDRLGEGQGMLLKKEDCEWSLRAYPTKPFLAVQVAYVNASKKPVRVRELMPWCVGDPRAGGVILGQDGSEVRALSLVGVPAGRSSLHTDYGNILCAVNPTTGQSMIAGFLTFDRSMTRITMSPDESGSGKFDSMRALSIYDPPKEVLPGERLESEVLYIALAEASPFTALERYGKAVAVVNRLPPGSPALLHGWDSWSSGLGEQITEASLRRELEVIDQELRPYGWTHFTIGNGWQTRHGNWQPDPAKFPNGLGPIVDEVHSRGMTAGIFFDPFIVYRDTPTAREHPGWLRNPRAQVRQEYPEPAGILDPSAPGVQEHLRGVASTMGEEWGFDALHLGPSVASVFDSEALFDGSRTCVEHLRLALQAITEGFGSGKPVTCTVPLMQMLPYIRIAGTGVQTAPLWTGGPSVPARGAVDAITTESFRYFLAPQVWSPKGSTAYFGTAGTLARWNLDDAESLDRRQSLAWFTAQALTGGAITFGDRPGELDAEILDVLRRLLPAPEPGARPLDLLISDRPHIWLIPPGAEDGGRAAVAIFNWDLSEEIRVPLSMAALGLGPNEYYTVYDCWSRTYHGTARAALEVNVAPGAVRLLSLEKYEDRPLYLADDAHIIPGVSKANRVEWVPEQSRLEGEIEAIQGTRCTVDVLVPQRYSVESFDASGSEIDSRWSGRVFRFAATSRDTEIIRWNVQFGRNGAQDPS